MIEELTRDQTEEIEEFREKWDSGFFLKTDVSEDDLTKIINKAYLSVNSDIPTEIIWHKKEEKISASPLTGNQMLGYILEGVNQEKLMDIGISIAPKFFDKDFRNFQKDFSGKISRKASRSIFVAMPKPPKRELNNDFDHRLITLEQYEQKIFFLKCVEILGFKQEVSKMQSFIDIVMNFDRFLPTKTSCFVSKR